MERGHFCAKALIFLALFFLSGRVAAFEVRECHSIEDVAREIDSDPSQMDRDSKGRTSTLILFDIDNTIFRAAQMIGTDEWFCDSVKQAYARNPAHKFLAKQRVIELWHAIQALTSVVPMEGDTTESVIRGAQDRFTVAALTTRSHQISATTISQLSSLGIDFARSAPISEMLWVPNAQEALFLKGVLFTSAYNKGIALRELLLALDYRPKKIIFLNDKRDHLEEIELVDRELGIPVLGLRYARGDVFQQEFCRTRAEKELEHFLQVLDMLADPTKTN